MTKKEVIEQFSMIKGLGKTKAELLFNSGFDSFEKIQQSTVKKLTEIKGINEKIANDIKEQVKDLLKTTDVDKIEKETIIEEQPTKETDGEKQPKKTVDSDDIEKKYIVKKKPKLTKDQMNNLKIRKQIKKRTPKFLREEWFRYKRISNNWRRPDGITSKMRINLKYRPNRVRVGYRGPKQVRGLHSSGFEEVLIHNIAELQNIDNTKQAIRIGSTVGTKKRMEIENKAESLEIRILNIGERKK